MLEHPKTQLPHNGTAVEIERQLKMGNQQERSDVTRARLAMMFDCEGFVSIYRTYKSKTRPVTLTPYAAAVSCDIKIMEWVRDALLAYDVPCHIQNINSQKYNHHSTTAVSRMDSYRISIVGMKRVEKLLPVITDFLITKQQPAILLAEFIKLRKGKQCYTYSEQEIALAESIRTCVPKKGTKTTPISSESIRLTADEYRYRAPSRFGKPELMMCSDLGRDPEKLAEMSSSIRL